MLLEQSISWLGTIVRVVGCTALISVVIFIGLKYREVFTHNSPFPDTPYDLTPPRPQRRVRSLRAPHPSLACAGLSSGPAPASYAVSATSNDIEANYPTPDVEDLPAERTRYILRWPTNRRSVSIGAVEEGQIAQRRRASDANQI
jgi:hypothetical protein